MGRGTPERRPGARSRGSRPAPALPAAAEIVLASTPSAGARRTATGLLLRFISCGLLGLGLGIVWRVTLAPAVIGPGSAFAGIFSLLLGFIVGGVLWYLHDVRRRRSDPDSVSDERLVFSFIVFAFVPFTVLLLVGLVWLVALLIGAA